MTERKASYLPEIQRLLPQAIDAEKGVLSSFFLSPRDVGALLAQKAITDAHFHAPAHAIIFPVMMEMNEQGKPIDIITVTGALRTKAALDSAGGPGYIAELFTFLPTAANVAHYLAILEEKYTLREIIKTCTEYAARCYEEQDEVPALLNEVEAKIGAIGNRTRIGDRKSTSTIVQEVIEEITTKDESKVFGISTGFPNLDLVARGMKGGNMIVIAGSTGDGKTSLALNIAEAVGVRGVRRGFEGERTKHPVLIFSLEMTQHEVVEALMQISSGVNLDTVTKDTASEAEQRTLGDASVRIGLGMVTIHDESEIDILRIRAIARKEKPRLIVLDYAQLAKGAKKKYERQDQEIADISRHCKLMAGELGATVIVISQLNDDGKTSGSRSLVKDANQMWMVIPGEDAQEKVVRICKQRRGRPDDVRMKWIEVCQKFVPKAV